ncbi:MAG: hypothetical protein NTX84_04520 [Nitrospirae bacterium]|nr:hypothetical protein [Nitrospirota bacterium]
MQNLRIPKAAVVLDMSPATLRWLRFMSTERVNSKGESIPGNGFAEAFLKLGGSVYVDVPRFREIWLELNGRISASAPQVCLDPDNKIQVPAHGSARFCPECGSRIISTNDNKEK